MNAIKKSEQHYHADFICSNVSIINVEQVYAGWGISENKMIIVLRKIKEHCLIVKLEKGQGLDLIGGTDYYNLMEHLFIDTSKYNILQQDKTLRNLSTTQIYLNTSYKHNEITEDKNVMQSKFTQKGCVHSLPRIHKDYQDMPSFRPIVHKTNITQYRITKYLASLLKLLARNDYIVEYSTEVAKHAQVILNELLSKGYKFVSFDDTSLFTNIPLNTTLKIILK